MAEGRPYAVDHSQTTEFGSKRFNDKFVKEQHHHQHDASHHEHHDPAFAASSSSRFILPLRESRTADVETVKPTEKKKSFFSIRHKVSLLHHSKSTHSVDPSDAQLPQLRSSTDSARKCLPFDQLFRSLPTELLIQVISFLPLQDVLNLRVAAKSWHSLITLNEVPIVRVHLEQNIPAYARRLYPINDSSELNFHYLCGLWHRLHVAAKLSFFVSEYVTRDIFLYRSEAQRTSFAGQYERMRRRLIPLIFTMFHFFETHRKLHLEHIAEHGGYYGLERQTYTINPIEKKIMDTYDDQTLLRVHEVFPLVISSFCRRLRPPTYVGRVERSLRGYIREKPSDDIQAAIIIIGGLRQAEKLWEIKGYNSRRSAVDTWYHGLTKDAPAESSAKPRRSIISFGRKKSTSGEARDSHGGREPHRSSFSSLHRTRSPSGSIDGSEYAVDLNWVFHTSLSAGMPMDSLDREQAQGILNDLPVLQNIWTRTAEALILQRRIVERPTDIRKNQHVILHLINGDGIDEEDEWCYGRNITESVRPPNVTGDDDAD